MRIENILVCKPIELLVDYLIEQGFTVIESKISDYHFHEVYIKLKGKYNENIDNIKIEKIEKINSKKYICSCNCSTVELLFE